MLLSLCLWRHDCDRRQTCARLQYPAVDIQARHVCTGAALGSAFGSVARSVGAATGYGVVEPQAYALVGVAAMLAGTCQVSFSHS